MEIQSAHKVASIKKTAEFFIKFIIMNKAWNFFILMIVVNVAAVLILFILNSMYGVPPDKAGLTLMFVNLFYILIYSVISYKYP